MNGDYPNGVQSTTSPLGDTPYAVSRRKLNELVNILRDLGAETVGVKLPAIAVIGNQSAGKSSLIEAISQIKLPRNGNTCTRCPMEVILSTGGTWKATISLRRMDAIPVKEDFASTKSKNEITALIRQAQLAVLNPTEDAARFLNFSEKQCLEYPSANGFTDDVVVIEITGAGTDVSFVDLPGQIQNVWSIAVED
jgi:vacuolar protein sorting-associated protein 1